MVCVFDTIVLVGQGLGMLGSRAPAAFWPRVAARRRGLLAGTTWRLGRTIGAGPSYVAIVDRA